MMRQTTQSSDCASQHSLNEFRRMLAQVISSQHSGNSIDDQMYLNTSLMTVKPVLFMHTPSLTCDMASTRFNA
jgi:hypothetical protein